VQTLEVVRLTAGAQTALPLYRLYKIEVLMFLFFQLQVKRQHPDRAANQIFNAILQQSLFHYLLINEGRFILYP